MLCPCVLCLCMSVCVCVCECCVCVCVSVCVVSVCECLCVCECCVRACMRHRLAMCWEGTVSDDPRLLCGSCCAPLNNYMNFNDTEGVYTYTFEAQKRVSSSWQQSSCFWGTSWGNSNRMLPFCGSGVGSVQGAVADRVT